jgi:fumarate reductase flavoprotein subunit
MDEYNALCDRGYDEIFNKDPKFLRALRKPPYYVIKSYASYLTTIGGIKIDHHMAVQNKEDRTIPGLYAGGDIAGGWESETYCMYLPGSAFGWALNSGRMAGENAAKYASV